MRTIKFRAWDSYLNEMYDWNKLIKLQEKQFLTLTNVLNNFVSHIIPMQFTGLKDKNGKEVYEGDIFILNMDDDEWHDYVEYREKEGKFELNKFVKAVTDLQLKDVIKFENCEIIGNIHENPELIK